jgi:hypothetical protein
VSIGISILYVLSAGTVFFGLVSFRFVHLPSSFSISYGFSTDCISRPRACATKNMEPGQVVHCFVAKAELLDTACGEPLIVIGDSRYDARRR